MKSFRIIAAIGLIGLIAGTQFADAQGSRRSGGDFEGIWKGQLTMDLLYDIPAADIERMSKPVDFELRVFSRGGAEIYFFSDDTEWVFSEQRDFRITLVGDNHGVIVAKVPSVLTWSNSIDLNMTFKDSSKDTVILSWSRLSTRDTYEFDGWDEFAVAGVAELHRTE